jgi:type IV secretion system protein TrbJ
MIIQAKTLSAKIFIAALASSIGLGGTAQAFPGLPQIVFDPKNVAQSVISVSRQTAMLARQVQQYTLQIQQYQNMLRNTVAPAAYIWAQAQSSINGLRNAVDQLESLKVQAGGLSQLLNQYQNVGYYRVSPCFTTAGCTPAQRAALRSRIEAKKAMIMASNKAVLQGLEAQQTKLSNDAAELENIQINAQTAGGQLEALGYANQLAGQSANQLVQLRGLLMAQQAAAAAQAQAAADEAALRAAAREAFNAGSYARPAPGSYTF